MKVIAVRYSKDEEWGGHLLEGHVDGQWLSCWIVHDGVVRLQSVDKQD